jgi:methylenetetrahydrofolate reductase (NADPH)
MEEPGQGEHVLAELLARPRYEVIPLDGAEEAVLEHVPPEVKVTVTTSPRKGLEPTLELVEKVAAHGYAVVPHLAARHVRDTSHLAELVERLRGAGADDVLVMAGDAEQPAGEFDGSLPLLRALAELGQPFRDVGITGYPESHAFISDDATIKAMFAKEEFATYIVSQICFDPQVTAAWVAAVWKRGTHLPIHIGLPGPVPRSKLLRISARIGVGDSLRFLRTHRGWLGHTFRGAFDPSPLVDGLEESLARPRPNVAGFHLFTFNDLERTEHWRQEQLEGLGTGALARASSDASRQS